jgi:hypothetical protein
MRNDVTRSCIALVLAGVTVISCDPDVDIPKNNEEGGYTMLYMPQAEGGARTLTLDISETTEEIILGAAYGGVGSASQKINVTIAVDAALVDAYNLAHGTHYQALPEPAYTLSSSAVVIEPGVFTSTPARVAVQIQHITPFKEYMLAVKIAATDANIPVNENLNEAYFIVKTSPNAENYAEFDRSLWTVAGFSTEEPKEATWGNGGQVIHTIDGNNGTFWHSKWDGGEAPPPHWFVIDMGEIKSMHGLKFLGRQSGNDGKPKEVVVELSTDATKWIPAGSFQLQNINDLQTQFLIDGFNQEARYFRVTVVSAYFAGFTHLAEIKAF